MNEDIENSNQAHLRSNCPYFMQIHPSSGQIYYELNILLCVLLVF